MCMYNTKQHPLVAKRDIIVVKYLRKSPGEDVWKTPCQCTRVELNKELIPLEDRMKIRPYNSICNSITAGAIHTLTVNNDRDWDGCQAFKAIIPKGTKYFVDVNGRSIVARKLLITDEKISIKVPDQSLIVDMLEQRPAVDGIAVGDFYFKDQGFMSPFDLTKEIIPNISGVVIGFKDNGDPLIWSGKVFSGIMDRDWLSQFDEFISNPGDDAEGEKHKAAFLKNYPKFDKVRFEAYAKCMKYKPEIGEWYIPAWKEQKIMIENLQFIHASAWYTGVNCILPTGWYWTSSEFGSYDCWCIGLNEYDARRSWYSRHFSGGVCFFLASTNKIPKITIKCLTSEEEKEPALKKIIKKYVRKRKA